MIHFDKIKFLESILFKADNDYVDGFKQEIIMYFDDYFSIENKRFQFLKTLHTTEEIEDWSNNLISSFVMKFDAEGESEQDFIWEYIQRV